MDIANGPIEPDWPPECPKCGAPMRLINPRDEDRTDYEPFWGCTEYANTKCRGTRQIDPRTGLPTYTEEEVDRQMMQRIQAERLPDPGSEI